MKIRTLCAALLAALAMSSIPAAAEEVSYGGPWELYHNGELVEIAHNIVPAAARTYLLKAGVGGGAQISAWYVMPFVNALDPTSALTGANFDATLDEFTNYVAGTRPAWAQDAEAAQAISNTTLASITISAGGGVINGIALTSVSTKGSATGTVLSAVRFAAPRTVLEGDVLEFRYTMQANAA